MEDHLVHLKSLENELKLTHVFVGTYEMRPFRKANTQVILRTRDVHFKRYNATREKEASAFASTLWALQRSLPVEEEPILLDHWEYLYTRSLGCIGLLKEHLNDALACALEDGATTVTYDHLRRTQLPQDKLEHALTAILHGEQEMTEKPGADELLLVKLGMRAASTRSAHARQL